MPRQAALMILGQLESGPWRAKRIGKAGHPGGRSYRGALLNPYSESP